MYLLDRTMNVRQLWVVYVKYRNLTSDHKAWPERRVKKAMIRQ